MLKDHSANTVDPDEMAQYEPSHLDLQYNELSHLDLQCLQIQPLLCHLKTYSRRNKVCMIFDDN